MSTEYKGGFFRSRSCGAELGSRKVVCGVKSGNLGHVLTGREKVKVHEEKSNVKDCRRLWAWPSTQVYVSNYLLVIMCLEIKN